jgi:cellulose synthase/poly-beta-1,6-N-acetylglucosamine synthase-like glycosyltransferase
MSGSAIPGLGGVLAALHVIAIVGFSLIIAGWAGLMYSRIRYSGSVRNASSSRRGSRDWPMVSLIMACKNVHHQSETNWRSHLASVYPGEVEAIFAVESEQDAAFAPLTQLAKSYKGNQDSPKRSVKVVVASYATKTTQKITNLLAAVEKVDPRSAYILFADDDAMYYPNTVVESVLALEEDPKNLCCTGFSFELPGPGSGLGNYCLAIYRMIQTVGFMGRYPPFVWGGCSLIRKADLEEPGGILDLWRNHGYSDDNITSAYALSKGKRIVSPPCNIFPSVLDAKRSFGDFVNWINRQMFVLDTYSFPFHKRYQHLQLAINLFFPITLALGTIHANYLFFYLLINTARAVQDGSSLPYFGSLEILACVNWLVFCLLLVMMNLLKTVLLHLASVLAPTKASNLAHSFNPLLTGLATMVAPIFIFLACVNALISDQVVWAHIKYTKREGLVSQVERLKPHTQ